MTDNGATVAATTKKRPPSLDGKEPEALVGPPKEHGKLSLIPLALIDIDEKENTREKIDQESDYYKDLRSSIHGEGLQEPVVVSAKGDRYVLRVGYHRTLICRELGFSDIPALIRVYNKPEDAYIANLAENLHRKNLRPYETANACWKLHKEFGLPIDKLIERVKISKSYAYNLIRCMEKLPKEIKEAWRKQDAVVPITDYIEISGYDSKAEMLEHWRILTGPKSPDGPKDKIGDKEKKQPKAQNRDSLKRCLAEIDKAESIIVGREQEDLDDRDRSILRAALRWACGDLKKYPLVMAPEDAGDED